ncbi:hypothetical protein GCK72_007124 [Caenorhabditis remanei]|uniref:Uncharacterized protein n=1 Tax=Caenorhabditis remanei TaxID=31234 RepID=A0A6A5HI93_CAERE|nr:hypothetical protein GCK72_007124 [Caenorhabditis remanei]KAF1767165.1 hypothetical protein GCK72_007124 [Caenorhabditis remanei]
MEPDDKMRMEPGFIQKSDSATWNCWISSSASDFDVLRNEYQVNTNATISSPSSPIHHKTPRRATTLEFTPGFVSINNSKYRHGRLEKVMGPVPKDNEEVIVLVDYMVVSGIQDAIPNWIQIRTNRLKINTPFWIFEEAVSPRLALPIESVTIVDPPAVNTEMIRATRFVSFEDTGTMERSLLDILRELPHNPSIQLEIQERRSFPNADFIQMIQTWIETPQQIGRRFSVNIRFNWRLQKRIQETFPMCQKQWIQMSEKKASSRRGISIDTFPDQRLVIHGRNGMDGVEKHTWTTMEVFPRHV